MIPWPTDSWDAMDSSTIFDASKYLLNLLYVWIGEAGPVLLKLRHYPSEVEGGY